MLFDLSSPGRKTAVRIIFGFLAVIFLVGFVGFGIGGEIGGGGIVDSITGNGGGGDTADQYEQQIEDAESKLESDPTNERALADLAQYRFLSGQVQLEVDETTGEPTGVPEESRSEFEAAVEAWTRYLATDPQKVDVATANNVVLAYRFLGDAGAAADAQELLAEANPSASTFVALATLRYEDLDFKAAEAAADRALEEATPAQEKQAKQILDQYAQAAERYQKQVDKQPDSSTGAEAGLESPFGGLGPSGGTVPPTAP